MEREQIIKALECWTSEYGCTGCPFIEQGCFDCGHIPTEIFKSIFALIKEREEQIFKLENRLKECENGYEGTLFLEGCKLHDAEEKIKELTEENGRLKSHVNRLKKYDEERDIALHARLISETRADTVRKMQERIAEHATNGYPRKVRLDVVDQIVEEMLEGIE